MKPRLGTLVLPACLAVFGCGDTNAQQKKTDATPSTPENTPPPAEADRGRCDAKDKRVLELDVNKDGRPDVWKFFSQSTDQGTKIEVLTCKEVDLNFDGHKDMWVYYDAAGNISKEEFDLDFDGKIDLWTYRQNGKIVREELDTNFDGQPDIWKFFDNEKLVRIERSANRNGKIDVWEYYEAGKLDRIGYDTTGSGHVDKWDRAPDEDPNAAPPAPTPPAATLPAPGVSPVAGGTGAAPSVPAKAPAVSPASEPKK